jgi:hypothetical protein
MHFEAAERAPVGHRGNGGKVKRERLTGMPGQTLDTLKNVKLTAL